MKKTLILLQLFVGFGVFAQSKDDFMDKGSLSLMYGKYSQYDKYGISYNTKVVKSWYFENSRVDLNVEFELAKMHSNSGSMWQGSVIPMFNWHFKNRVYLQAGIGGTYLSSKNFGDKEFGSKLNFSDNIGIGYQISPSTSITYRISHYSNAGIKKPNPGLNMQQVILSYRF